MKKKRFASTIVLILFLAMLASNINQPKITANVAGMSSDSPEFLGSGDITCNEDLDCCPEENCGNLCDGLWECIDNLCMENLISCGPGYVCEINQCICYENCFDDSDDDNGGPGDLSEGFTDGGDDGSQESTEEDEETEEDGEEKPKIYYDGDYPKDDSQESQQIEVAQIVEESKHIRPAPPSFLGRFCVVSNFLVS